MAIVHVSSKPAEMQETIRQQESIYTLAIAPDVFPQEVAGLTTESMWSTYTPNQKVQFLKENNLYHLLAEVKMDSTEALVNSAEGFQGEMLDQNVAMPPAIANESNVTDPTLLQSQYESNLSQSTVNEFAQPIPEQPTDLAPTIEQPISNNEAFAQTPPPMTTEVLPSSVPEGPAESDIHYEEFKKAAGEIHEIASDASQEQFGQELEGVDGKKAELENLSLEEQERIATESGHNILPSNVLPPKFSGYSITSSSHLPGDPKTTANDGSVKDAKTWAYSLWQKVLDALGS